MTDFDLVIAGGGMTGASLASALSATAWRVAIVDPRTTNEMPGARVPNSGQDFSPRVSALSPTSCNWLQKVGAWPLIPPERLGPYTTMHVWDAEGSGQVRFMAGESDPASETGALGHIVENAWVEYALWNCLHRNDALTEFNGLSVRRASRRRDDAWHLELADRQDCTQTITCRQLVIADGARSPLRAALGFMTRHWSCRQTALVATVHHSLPHEQVARQAFHREGPLAFLPLSLPHQSSVVWSMDSERAKAFLGTSADSRARELEAGIDRRLGEVRLDSAVFSFPLHQMFARRYWQPGAVLVGDAAHQLHPLAGQGVNLGLQDVEALADILCPASTQRIDVTEPLLYRRYARQRQGHNLAGIAAMEGFRRLFAPTHPALHAARNLGMRAFNESDLLRYLARQWASGPR